MRVLADGLRLRLVVACLFVGAWSPRALAQAPDAEQPGEDGTGGDVAGDVDADALEGLDEPAPTEAPVEDETAGMGQIEDWSLSRLLSMETTVASTSRVGTSLRETPGIVTVITHEEITAMGARDLVDVLRTVPGFTFGTDVQGVIGLGMRGLWGQEGKILLIVDGHEINETLYATNTFGNRFPVTQIERIEIIRGPGSVVYGGFAELAVIRITTRGAHDLMGAEGSVTYGHGMDGFGRANLALSYADELVPELELSLHGYVGQGRRGGGTYTDFFGASYDMSDQDTDPMMINLGVKYRDLRVRVLAEDYHSPHRDAFVDSLPWELEQHFRGFWASADYTLRAGDDLTIVPRLGLKWVQPWNQPIATRDGRDLEAEALSYDVEALRYTAQVTADYEIREGMVATGGTQLYVDSAPDYDVSYVNFALFAQLGWENPIVNVTAGARFESHSEFGPSFVPRIGITRVIDRFHFKALFSLAFRSPSIENIGLQPDIEPERTTSFEIEAGYQLTDNMIATINAYDLTVAKPIVYFYDGVTDTEGYENGRHLGSRGIDFEYRLKYGWGFAALRYSMYVAGSFVGDAFLGDDGGPDAYQVPGESGSWLGMPNHKITLVSSFDAGDFRISPWVVVHSPVHGYLTGDGMGNGVLGESDWTPLLNLYADYRFPWVRGLRLGAGVYNIADVDDLIVQAYNGGHAPLRGMEREFLARLTYTLEL